MRDIVFVIEECHNHGDSENYGLGKETFFPMI